MSKRDEALEVIRSLGLPRKQQNERSSLTFLALAGLREDDPRSKSSRPLLRIWDMMAWMRDHYSLRVGATRGHSERRAAHREEGRKIHRIPDKTQSR